MVQVKEFTIFVKKEYLLEIDKLKKENFELTDYKNNVSNIVLDAIGRERTCIGSNVLCELAEQLNIIIE